MGRAKIRTRTRFGTGQNSDTDKIWDGLRFGQISDKFRTRTRFRTDMASEKFRTGYRTRFRTPFRTPFQTQVRTGFRTNFGQDFKDHAALHDHRRRTGPRRQRSRFTTDKARDRISDRTSDKTKVRTYQGSASSTITPYAVTVEQTLCPTSDVVKLLLVIEYTTPR